MGSHGLPARVFVCVESRLAEAREALGDEVARIERVDPARLAFAIAAARADDDASAIVAVVEAPGTVEAALGAGADTVVDGSRWSREWLACAARLASERALRRVERAAFERALAHRDRLASLGTVIAGVAHEIRSPATAVTIGLESIDEVARALVDHIGALREAVDAARMDAGDAARVRERIGALASELDAAEIASTIEESRTCMRAILELASDLRLGARESEELPNEVVDVVRLVRQVLRLSGAEARPDVRVELDVPDESPRLWLPRTRLLQIVSNLVRNALDAMVPGERPLHRLRVSIRSDETTLVLAFADSGSGMTRELAERAFEPFFTTKGADRGTGLGLATSRALVRRLGGDLTIDASPDEGSVAMIFLPCDLRAASGDPRAPIDAAPRRRLLLVADEARLVREVEKAVGSRHDVLVAEGVVEALDLLASGARVDLIACDPDARFGARSFGAELAARWPTLSVVALDRDPRRLADAVSRARR